MSPRPEVRGADFWRQFLKDRGVQASAPRGAGGAEPSPCSHRVHPGSCPQSWEMPRKSQRSRAPMTYFSWTLKGTKKYAQFSSCMPTLGWRCGAAAPPRGLGALHPGQGATAATPQASKLCPHTGAGEQKLHGSKSEREEALKRL